MNMLYSSVEISKVLEDTKVIRKYYITQDSTFGFKITKTENNELIEKEIYSASNIVNDENEIKSLIDEVIKCEDDAEQINYIVEDYIKSKSNISIN